MCSGLWDVNVTVVCQQPTCFLETQHGYQHICTLILNCKAVVLCVTLSYCSCHNYIQTALVHFIVLLHCVVLIATHKRTVYQFTGAPRLLIRANRTVTFYLTLDMRPIGFGEAHSN